MKWLKQFSQLVAAFACLVGFISGIGLSLYNYEYVTAVCVLVLGIAAAPTVKALVMPVWNDEEYYAKYPTEDKNIIKKS